eukprot:388210-Hanusia_phi.AAC.1
MTLSFGAWPRRRQQVGGNFEFAAAPNLGGRRSARLMAVPGDRGAAATVNCRGSRGNDAPGGGAMMGSSEARSPGREAPSTVVGPAAEYDGTG